VDRLKYLDEAILNVERQINAAKMNRGIDPKILENLNRQRLHFLQERATILESKNKKPNPGLFGILDILDEEEVIRLPTKSDQPNKNTG
jgi:hypothetical protein